MLGSSTLQVVPSTGVVSSRRLSSSVHWSPIGIYGRVRSLEGREPRRTSSKRGRSEDEVGKGRSQALGPTFSILVASFDRRFYSLHSSSFLFCASSCFYSVHSSSLYSVQVVVFILCKVAVYSVKDLTKNYVRALSGLWLTFFVSCGVSAKSRYLVAHWQGQQV